MSDDADLAGDRQEKELERAIAAARHQPAIEPTGLCLYCEEAVGPSARFCGPDCRDSFDNEKRIRDRLRARR